MGGGRGGAVVGRGGMVVGPDGACGGRGMLDCLVFTRSWS